MCKSEAAVLDQQTEVACDSAQTLYQQPPLWIQIKNVEAIVRYDCLSISA
jgi:hypothetical protein